jgi:hypothetical protein
MCTSRYIRYACGWKKEREFIQYPERQGTNVKGHPVTRAWGKDSTNYCSRHPIKPYAPVKYMDQNGQILED